MTKFIIPILFIFTPQLVGFLGSFFTVSSIDTWYANLSKPFFNPPNWIFGPVWVLLYAMMGIASYLVWQSRRQNSGGEKALIFYGVHLIFNFLWSIIFFGLKNPGLALVEILFLWAMIAVLVKMFYGINKISGILLIPYLLWVSFASVLNFYIWILN